MKLFILFLMWSSLDVSYGYHMTRALLCHYPCQCPVRTLNCNSGVSVRKDGCDCCYMCARQHGDLCNVKDVCDHGMFCDMTPEVGRLPGSGICKANASKPCVVNGVTYKDGEKFQPDCSRKCTCQNGMHGCINLCEDEDRIPSFCKKPRLEKVEGRCCKQWSCEVESERRQSNNGGISPRHIQDEFKPMSLKSYAEPKKYNSNYYQNTQPHTAQCTTKYGKWSVCSKSCDVGVSKRMVTNSTCHEYQEKRLCLLRPCNTRVPATEVEKCTPTARLISNKHRIKYEDCISMKERNLKFCTNCKKRRCCYPKRETTRKLEFQCGDGRRQTFNFMWIKSCTCDKQCYVRGSTKNRRHRRQRG